MSDSNEEVGDAHWEIISQYLFFILYGSIVLFS